MLIYPFVVLSGGPLLPFGCFNILSPSTPPLRGFRGAKPPPSQPGEAGLGGQRRAYGSHVHSCHNARVLSVFWLLAEAQIVFKLIGFYSEVTIPFGGVVDRDFERGLGHGSWRCDGTHLDVPSGRPLLTPVDTIYISSSPLPPGFGRSLPPQSLGRLP
ncbi:unnamed protein product [Ectocarpus fasciculatus]